MQEYTTIGMDLGDKSHKVVIIGGENEGREISRVEIDNTAAAISALLQKHKDARLVIETGTHCRWISALAQGMGLRVYVANARKLRAIWQSSRKNDWNDAQTLAKIGRADPSLLHPVELRGEHDQRLMRIAKARDLLVRQRTASVNQIRGFCKSVGARARKCSSEAFASLADELPAEVAEVAAILLKSVEQLSANIKRYDALLEKTLMESRGEQARRVMRISGVGPVTAAVFLAAAGDVAKFGGSARAAGPYFGLVPRQSQSGGSDPQLRTTKEGNALVRRSLVQCANHILGRFGKDSDLRRFGLRVAERAGGGKSARKKAKVAVARKLATVMFAMLKNGSEYKALFAEGQTQTI